MLNLCIFYFLYFTDLNSHNTQQSLKILCIKSQHLTLEIYIWPSHAKPFKIYFNIKQILPDFLIRTYVNIYCEILQFSPPHLIPTRIRYCL